MEFALANGITQFAEGEPKRRNNDTVRVYQPLEGGNEVSEANVVTLCSKGEIPYCVSRKRPLDGACLGRQLDGESRQGNAEASKNLLNVESPTDPLVRGRLRPSKPLRPSAPSAAAENLLGSRTKPAEEKSHAKNA